MTTNAADLRDRFSGCLLGCAVGDALGAPYEGLWARSIPDAATLLAGFAEFEGYPRGQYTDDTQLSLATVRSIVRTGRVSPPDVARSFARLWRAGAVIGPGGACMQAGHRFLRTGDWSSCGAPVGQAGNGAAMRAAVVGLAFLREPARLPGVVADLCRITHHDPRAVAGGVAVARAAHIFAVDPGVRPEALCAMVAADMAPLAPAFAAEVGSLPALLEGDPASAAARIARAGVAQPEFDAPIVTPFVVPTVLAALWSVLRQPDSWGDAVAGAIGLGGDVDTLGAIVGALAGVRLGAAAIPPRLAESVVDAGRIGDLALPYHARAAAGIVLP